MALTPSSNRGKRYFQNSSVQNFLGKPAHTFSLLNVLGLWRLFAFLITLIFLLQLLGMKVPLTEVFQMKQEKNKVHVKNDDLT